MTVDPKMMKSADFEKVAEIDFVEVFAENIRTLQEVIGISRKIEKVPGQVVKTYKVTGTLENGTVAEGEVIPLSKYATKVDDAFELTVKKWRKETTIEAINDKGYQQAVTDTDGKMIKDIQKGIRTQFFTFLNTATGGTDASGVGLKGALAQSWGNLQVLFEDYGQEDQDFLYFVNPLDIADYLEKADVTVQTAFGMSYIEKFLGLYDVVISTGVTKGTVRATAKDNIILYFTNPANSEVAKAFEFTTDETGLVGVHHNAKYDNLACDTTAICGVALYAEMTSGIVKATIVDPTATDDEEESI